MKTKYARQNWTGSRREVGSTEKSARHHGDKPRLRNACPVSFGGLSQPGCSYGLASYLTGGHDFIYGGLGDDFLHGGAGDDYLNADDNLETNGGLHNVTDRAEFADAVFAYGGGGYDVLIGNTGAD